MRSPNLSPVTAARRYSDASFASYSSPAHCSSIDTAVVTHHLSSISESIVSSLPSSPLHHLSRPAPPPLHASAVTEQLYESDFEQLHESDFEQLYESNFEQLYESDFEDAPSLSSEKSLLHNAFERSMSEEEDEYDNDSWESLLSSTSSPTPSIYPLTPFLSGAESVCDAQDASEAMRILETGHATLYKTLLHRFKHPNEPPPTTHHHPQDIPDPAAKHLLDHIKRKEVKNDGRLDEEERVKSRVRFWDEDDEKRVPRRIVERVRLENLLRKMEGMGTFADETVLSPSSIKARQQKTSDLADATILRHLKDRVVHRNLQEEVTRKTFWRSGVEDHIVQGDHITLINEILQTLPQPSTPSPEIWRRLLERVRCASSEPVD
ncbi:hypothetical protein HDU67_006033 [Dinochytrium kinnereticum]|nr:hypothetical protein HDU67_006033 [Dinochytrium kinnereticum]